MKSLVTVLIVILVGTLGYFLFVKDSPKTNNSTGTEQSETSSGESINLSSQGLTQISRSVFDNSLATTLDVSGNNLTGALPGEIRFLANLEVLNASNNKMTGIPAEIGQLSKLRTANFANNQLTGLPNEIGNLKNLETLDLRGNPNVSQNDISQIQSKIPNAKILTD